MPRAAQGQVAANPAVQSRSATVAAGLFVDSNSGDGRRFSGPAVMFGLGVGGPIRFEAGVARIDFPVGPDDYHSYHLTGVFGSEITLLRSAVAAGVFLGAGAMRVDDVSESDEQFVSGARWSSVGVPGFFVRRSLPGGRGVSLLMRDYVTGIANGIADPGERDIRHYFVWMVAYTF